MKALYSQEQFEKQNLNTIGCQWLDDSTLVKIMPSTPADCPVQILAPLNRFDNSIDALKIGLKTMRDNANIQHMMFPVGPGHWYWVKISKSQPYTVDVLTLTTEM